MLISAFHSRGRRPCLNLIPRGLFWDTNTAAVFFFGGGEGGTNIPAMTPCVKPQKPERPESISYLTIMSGLTAILSARNPKIRSALQLFCLFGCFDRVLFWSHSKALPPHVNAPLCPSKEKIISVCSNSFCFIVKKFCTNKHAYIDYHRSWFRLSTLSWYRQPSSLHSRYEGSKITVNLTCSFVG